MEANHHRSRTRGRRQGVVVGEGVFEKDVTLSIARKVRSELESKLGVETVLSRSQGQTLSLEDRVLAANGGRSDLFLSIHLGNGYSPTPSRSYVYLAKLLPAEDLAQDRRQGASFELVRWDRAPVDRASSKLPPGRNPAKGNQRADQWRRPAEVSACAPEAAVLVAMPAVLLELGNVKQAEFREAVLAEPFQDSVAIAGPGGPATVSPHR